MDFIRYKIKIKPLEPCREMLIAQLAALGFDSFEETTEGLDAYIPYGDIEEYKVKEVIDHYTAYATLIYEVEKLPKINWNETWEKSYQPISIKDKIYVRADFHPIEPKYESEILIHPKMSFGTGHHETTYLMLEYMTEIDFYGKQVLDMGCGTAVLGIYAALKGASYVEAIDIDAWAVENAKENVKKNKVQVNIKQGGAEVIDENIKFDILLANINKNILLAETTHYLRTMKKEATIIMSGFLAQDRKDMEHAMREKGLEKISEKEKNAWLAIQWKYIK